MSIRGFDRYDAETVASVGVGVPAQLAVTVGTEGIPDGFSTTGEKSHQNKKKNGLEMFGIEISWLFYWYILVL